MPLTTYTAGEVLTAQSLNDNFAFAATGGSTLILAQSFSAAATVSMAAGTFTSTFENYLVIFGVTASSLNQSIALRVNDAGTPRTVSNYAGAKFDVTIAGTTAATGATATSFNFGATGTATRASFAFNVFSPQIASTRTVLSHTGVGINQGLTSASAIFGGMQFTLDESHDGLTFLVGGTITGNLQVYGLADS